jgi:hypothetical protein
MTTHKKKVVDQAIDQKHLFDEKAVKPPSRGAWKMMLPLLVILLIGGYFAYRNHWDAKITTAGAVLVGFGSGLELWLLGLISMVPLIGPILVKILTMSFIWLLNAVGYLVSYIAIKRGYSKDVITYRGITIALLVGIVIGFVIGHMV